MIYKFLGLKVWVVDDAFVSAGSKLERLKSIPWTVSSVQRGGSARTESESFLDTIESLLGG